LIGIRKVIVRALFLNKWRLFLAGALLSVTVFASAAGNVDSIALTQLPIEAQKTYLLIKQGGPFPYPKDGAVFGNYERLLPKQMRGYYHEYTVRTPKAKNRGARRIVTGGPVKTPEVFYYTSDHYASFKRIQE
jgi:ribonuclease T1